MPSEGYRLISCSLEALLTTRKKKKLNMRRMTMGAGASNSILNLVFSQNLKRGE